MHVVVACDKFKGTFSAREATRIVATVTRACFPRARISEMPMADGGEGTIDVVAGEHGRLVPETVAGPSGASESSAYALLDDGTAVVEMARASGLGLMGESALRPLTATSRGTGDLILAAARAEPAPSRVVVGVGGSASTDGGTGAARALGWRFLDQRGDDLPSGGAGLTRLARVSPPSEPTLPMAVLGAVDVGAPLLGRAGAARRFAPQKGAAPHEVEKLERGLAKLAQVCRRDLGIELDDVTGAGAGGGMGAGLVAFFGARLVAGSEFVAETVGLPEAVASADLVITGEGRLDEQTSQGKCVAYVASLATREGVDCYAVAGQITAPAEELRALGLARWASVTERTGGSPSGDPSVLAAAAGLLFNADPNS